MPEPKSVSPQKAPSSTTKKTNGRKFSKEKPKSEDEPNTSRHWRDHFKGPGHSVGPGYFEGPAQRPDPKNVWNIHILIRTLGEMRVGGVVPNAEYGLSGMWLWKEQLFYMYLYDFIIFPSQYPFIVSKKFLSLSWFRPPAFSRNRWLRTWNCKTKKAGVLRGIPRAI